MVICHIGRNYQMRAAKIAQVMQNHVTQFYIGEAPPMFVPAGQFKVYMLSPPKKHRFMQTIKAIDSLVDIYHVHTKPDYFMRFVRESTDKPIVWDCHDLYSIIDGSDKETEQYCKDNCDALLSVNPELTELINVDKPKSYYRTYVPKVWMPPMVDAQLNSLIIATGLSVTPGHYRHWIPVFEKIHKLGINLDCYASHFNAPQQYIDTGVTMHGATELLFLLGSMSQAEAGICGFPYENALTRLASPNKFYEAIASAIPVICFGSGVMADEIRSKNLGVVVESAEEIPEALLKIRADKLREYIRDIRVEYCMETQVDRVLSLYRQLKKERI